MVRIYYDNFTETEDGTMIVFDNGRLATDTVYSDRLYQWDSQRYNDLCQKHFGNQGQYWSGRESSKIELFLRDYIGDDSIILCRIEESENESSGYPLWRFDYSKSNLKQE